MWLTNGGNVEGGALGRLRSLLWTFWRRKKSDIDVENRTPEFSVVDL